MAHFGKSGKIPALHAATAEQLGGELYRIVGQEVQLMFKTWSVPDQLVAVLVFYHQRLELVSKSQLVSAIV